MRSWAAANSGRASSGAAEHAPWRRPPSEGSSAAEHAGSLPGSTAGSHTDAVAAPASPHVFAAWPDEDPPYSESGPVAGPARGSGADSPVIMPNNSAAERVAEYHRERGELRNELLRRALDREDPPTLVQLLYLAFGVHVQTGDRLQNRRRTCKVFNAPAPQGHYLRTMDANEQFEALRVQRVWIPRGDNQRRWDPARWGVAVRTAEGWVNVSKGMDQFAFLVNTAWTRRVRPR